MAISPFKTHRSTKETAISKWRKTVIFQAAGTIAHNEAATNFIEIQLSKAYDGILPISVNITEFGGYGQFIAGNFTGTVKDAVTGAIGPLPVSFRGRKVQW